MRTRLDLVNAQIATRSVEINVNKIDKIIVGEGEILLVGDRLNLEWLGEVNLLFRYYVKNWHYIEFDFIFECIYDEHETLPRKLIVRVHDRGRRQIQVPNIRQPIRVVEG